MLKTNSRLLLLGMILLVAASSSLWAQQDQIGTQQGNTAGGNGVNITSFLIEGNVAPACNNGSNHYWVRSNFDPHNDIDPSQVGTFFAIPGGNGDQKFTARVGYAYNNALDCGYPEWNVRINGVLCNTCVVSVEHLAFTPCDFLTGYGSSGVDRLTITHQAGDAWDLQNGVQEVSLAASMLTTQAEIRFGAIAVGTSYSEVLGYFDAPAAPLFILRDPPGDGSYSSLTTTNNTCFGQSFSVTTDQSINAWFKAKLGVEGSVGLIVMTDFEIFAEVGGSVTAGRTETSDLEYQTCLEATETYTTPQTGSPEDVFIGSAIRYAYGMGRIVARPGCSTVEKDARFAMTPVDALSSYTLTESTIRKSTIPNLEDQIGLLTPGTQEYKNAVNQLSVWEQTLAMNDAIKMAAPEAVQRAFSSGPGSGWTLTQSTSQTQSVDMNVYLEGGLSFEYGAYIGGSGIGAGGELKLRNEYGSGQSNSNSSTNTMAYYLSDDVDEEDYFNVIVGRDSVFGTYTFQLDSIVSRSSCPYEGGYQIDQPDLGVQNIGQSTMSLTDVPLGTSAVFPLYICNNSSFDRTYYLKYNANTNTEGALLQVLGNPLTNDNGVELDVPANDCLPVTNLLLSQPVSPIGPDYLIDLYLYSLCEPSIRSTITIEAHYDLNTGLEDADGHSADWVTVRPNLSSGHFQLLLTDQLTPTTVMIMDATGRTVKAPFVVEGSGTYNLDLNDVAPGMYFLLASKDGQQQSLKLIVQQ